MSHYTDKILYGAFGLAIRLLSVGLLLGISMILAQNLGRSGFGTYTYAMSWVMMFSMIQRSGLAILLVREVSVYNNTKALSNLNGLVFRSWQFLFVGSLILVLLLSIICESLVWLNGSTEYRLIYFAIPLLPLLGAISIFEGVTRGFGRALAGQLGEFIIRHAAHLLLFGGIIFGFLPGSATPETAIVTSVLGTLIALIVVFFIYLRVYRPYRSSEKTYEDSRWKKSFLVLTSSTGMAAINGYIAIVIAGLWLPSSEIASLQVAIQVTILISMSVIVFNIMHAADMAKNYAAGKIHTLQKLVIQGCWLSFAFGACIALVLIAGGQSLIVFLFGNEFSDTYQLVLILTAGQLFNAATGSPSTVLNAAHHERKVLTAVILSTLSILVLIFPLGLLFGTTGIAITITLGLVVWKIAAIYFLKRETNIICLPLLGKHINPN